MKILPPPGPERRRQLLILGLLMPVLGYVLWSTFGAESTPTAPPQTAANSVARITAPQRDAGTAPAPAQATAPAGSNGAASLLPEPVKLAALEPVSEGPVIRRNPFAYGQKPAPPPPPPPPYVPPPPPLPPPPPPPPPMPVSYIGSYVGQDGRPFGSFRIKVGDNIVVENAFEGQVLVGQYRVIKISPTSATVGFVDGSNTRILMKGAPGGG
jgi:hypothetical protein